MSWGEIKKALNSTLGDSGFKALNELIRDDFTTVSEWLSAGNVPIVKSVQRGTVANGKTTNSSSGTVNISSVAINKSIVLLNGIGNVTGPDSNANNMGAFGVKLTSMSATNFKYERPVYSERSGDSYDRYAPGFSWQVIEFY